VWTDAAGRKCFEHTPTRELHDCLHTRPVADTAADRTEDFIRRLHRQSPELPERRILDCQVPGPCGRGAETWLEVTRAQNPIRGDRVRERVPAAVRRRRDEDEAKRLGSAYDTEARRRHKEDEEEVEALDTTGVPLTSEDCDRVITEVAVDLRRVKDGTPAAPTNETPHGLTVKTPTTRKPTRAGARQEDVKQRGAILGDAGSQSTRTLELLLPHGAHTAACPVEGCSFRGFYLTAHLRKSHSCGKKLYWGSHAPSPANDAAKLSGLWTRGQTSRRSARRLMERRYLLRT
jgi:hypothetical protein